MVWSTTRPWLTEVDTMSFLYGKGVSYQQAKWMSKRGNPIRMLLEYVGQEFHYQGYGRFPQDGWAENRTKLGLIFPNLPHYIDGELRMTQSNAILRYIGRKHNLVATEEADVILQDMLEGTLTDIQNSFAKLVYASQDFDMEKVTWRKEMLEPFLNALDAKVLKSKKHLLGDKLNYNDFVLAEMLDVYQKVFPDLLRKFEEVQRYYNSMMALPAVKGFMESNRNLIHINGPHAKWGG